jgi:endonuclease/exonuclease/phosphatase (EEP) superfamily protein YafD
VKFVSVSLLGVAIVLFAITVAGYAGKLRYCELLGDFRPYYFAFGMILAVALALCIRRDSRRLVISTAAALGISILINGLEVLPWLMARPAASERFHGAKFKAIAFNVENVNRQFAETRAFVQREAPDIIMFCESVGSWPVELLPLQQQMPFHVRLDDLTIDMFSRHPVIRTQVFGYGSIRGFAAIGLQVNDNEITFIVAHAPPRHWFGEPGFRARTAMLEEGLAERVPTLRRPVLLMGDLNASPWSPAYKTMIKKSGLLAARRGSGLVMTHHGHGVVSQWLWRPIDHCLFTSEVLGHLSTGPDLGSDHLPIIAELFVPLGKQ